MIRSVLRILGNMAVSEGEGGGWEGESQKAILHWRANYRMVEGEGGLTISQYGTLAVR